jgi:hypothetical protein
MPPMMSAMAALLLDDDDRLIPAPRLFRWRGCRGRTTTATRLLDFLKRRAHVPRDCSPAISTAMIGEMPFRKASLSTRSS